MSVDDVGEIAGSLRETLQTECPPRDPLVEDLIDRGQIVAFAARPGTGKTPFLTQLASAASAGVPFLGLKTQRCRIGIIDLESSPDRHRKLMQCQWQAMGLNADDVAENIDVFVRGNPHDPNSSELDRVFNKCGNPFRWTWLMKLTQRRGYDLVIIDTALAFTPFKAGYEEKARQLFSWASTMRRTPPYPAIAFVLHLRKPDRKTVGPSLLQDPFAWTDEFLGSIVWSANADVRLGLEALGEDGHVVFSGFRRGDGEVSPRIIESHLEEIDGRERPTMWKLIDAGAAADSVLAATQLTRFVNLPVGQEMTWSELLSRTGAPKVSLNRLVKRTSAVGLLEYDPIRKTYRRKA